MGGIHVYNDVFIIIIIIFFIVSTDENRTTTDSIFFEYTLYNVTLSMYIHYVQYFKQAVAQNTHTHTYINI